MDFIKGFFEYWFHNFGHGFESHEIIWKVEGVLAFVGVGLKSTVWAWRWLNLRQWFRRLVLKPSQLQETFKTTDADKSKLAELWEHADNKITVIALGIAFLLFVFNTFILAPYQRGDVMSWNYTGLRLSQVLRFMIALPANERFIYFNSAFKQFSQRSLTHGEANTMRHEPSGFVGNVQHAVKLMSAHSLFGRTKEKNRHEPFAHRNVRILKDCSNRHRKLFPASPALVKSFASGPLRHKRVNALGLTVIPAMRTNWAIGPTERFKQLTRFVIVRILLGQLNKVQFFGTI